ncbi:MAG TPA: insulinase family protein [Exilispira sp.]|nr:insulinase family protein [Exilispira sp.]
MKKGMIKKRYGIIIILSALFVSILFLSAGCATRQTAELKEDFYSSIQKIGNENDNIYQFTLPNGIKVYVFQQPKDEVDEQSTNFYKSVEVSYIFKNVPLCMHNLPAGTQNALTSYLVAMPGKKYDTDKISALLNMGYLLNFDLDIKDDYIEYYVEGSSTHLSSYLTDIAADMFSKTIATNINYQAWMKDFSKIANSYKYDLQYYSKRLALTNAFYNTFYGASLDTSDSYLKISYNSLSKLYSRLIQPKNLTIIVRGGKMSPSVIADILWEKFSFMKNRKTDIDNLTFTEIDRTKLSKKNLETYSSSDSKRSLISCFFPGPLNTSKDYAPFNIACDVLNNKLFINVRIKNNLVYDIYSYVASLNQSWGYIFLQTNNPENSMKIVKQTIKDLITNGITEFDLESFNNSLFTDYYLYSSYGKGKYYLFHDVVSLLNEQIDSYYANFLKTYKNVTIAEVNEVIKKYFDYFYWGFIAPDANTIKNTDKSLFFLHP